MLVSSILLLSNFSTKKVYHFMETIFENKKIGIWGFGVVGKAL
jgi:lactate dehydrogenase-like 2-hydroxyacid dehydrogenase